jgi:hypothetical protein
MIKTAPSFRIPVTEIMPAVMAIYDFLVQRQSQTSSFAPVFGIQPRKGVDWFVYP